MEIGTEMALRHLALRVALLGDGAIERHADGDLEATARLPGGHAAAFSRSGHATLFDNGGKTLGSGPVHDAAFFASLMHNCDLETDREWRSGVMGTIAFADAIIDADDRDLERAILASPATQAEGVIDYHPLLSSPDVKRAAESSVAAVREAFFAWRATRVSGMGSAPWDGMSSQARWNGRMARLTSIEDPIPAANGDWFRIENQCGHMEAARGLGINDGRLDPFGEGRQAFVLKGFGVPGWTEGRIAAAAIFEDGCLNRVVPHADRSKRPPFRINEDLQPLLAGYDRDHEQTPTREPGSWR